MPCDEKWLGEWLAQRTMLGKTMAKETINSMPENEKLEYFKAMAKKDEVLNGLADVAAKLNVENTGTNDSMNLKGLINGFRLPGSPVHEGKVMKALGGLPANFMDPSSILGDFISPLKAGLLEHLQKYPNMNNAQAFRTDIHPILEVMSSNVPKLPPMVRDYANRYIESWMNGGTAYNFSTGATHFFKDLTRNLLRGWATAHTKISVGNLTEVDKALAIYGPKAYGNGLKELLAITKGNIFKEIPEVKQAGGYGKEYTAKGGKVGKVEHVLANINTPSENMLRNIGYYVAKAAGEDGIVGIHRTAFAHELGNEPLVYHALGGKDAIPLMRFTIEGSKFYYTMLWHAGKEAKAGNFKPLQNALLYHLTMLAKAGAKGSVPPIIWAAIGAKTSKEWQDATDKFIPFSNIPGKLTNGKVSLVQMTQPGNLGAGFALDYAMLTRDWADILSTPKDANKEMTNKNYQALALRMVELLALYAQLTENSGLIPQDAHKAIKTLRRKLDNDRPVDIGAELAKSMTGAEIKK